MLYWCTSKGRSIQHRRRTQVAAGVRVAAGRRPRVSVAHRRSEGVTYFGSAGLNAVLDCHKQGLRTGISVRLVADNDLVVRPIEVTNLDSLLDLYPALPDALEGRELEQGS